MKKITFFVEILICKNSDELIILSRFKIIFEIKLYIISLSVFLIIANMKLFKSV